MTDGKKNTRSVEALFTEWRKDPRYVAEYEALSEEFALAVRQSGGDAARARKVLERAGVGNPPDKGDELPKPRRRR